MRRGREGGESHGARRTRRGVENSKDNGARGAGVDRAREAGHAYRSRGHGRYTWAADIGACYRQLEALETLLAVELDRRRLG